MTQVLLDTSGFIAVRRGHPDVVSIVRRAERIAVTPVVIGELLSGFRKGHRRAENERDLERFLCTPRMEILAVDRETADRYAAIADDLRARGRPIPTNDLWIAASAMQHGLELVTTDAHFKGVPQILARVFAPL